MRHAAALQSRLHNAPVLLCRFGHLAAFENVVGSGLLHIDVFASLHGPHRPERVPMVRRGHRDHVHAAVVEHAAHVTVALWAHARRLLHFRLRAFERRLIDVAQRCEAHIRPFQKLMEMIASAAAQADNGYVHSVVRPAGAPSGRKASAGRLQESPSGVHCYSPLCESWNTRSLRHAVHLTNSPRFAV